MLIILTLLVGAYHPPTDAQRAANVEKIMNMKVFQKEMPESSVADLTLVDLSKVLTLPQQRRDELRCVGRAFAKDAEVPVAARAKLMGALAPILSFEAEMTLEQADDFIRMYANESAYPNERAVCGPLWKAAVDGLPLPLLGVAAD